MSHVRRNRVVMDVGEAAPIVVEFIVRFAGRFLERPSEIVISDHLGDGVAIGEQFAYGAIAVDIREIPQLAVSNRVNQTAIFDGFSAVEIITVFENGGSKQGVAAFRIPFLRGILGKSFRPILSHGGKSA